MISSVVTVFSCLLIGVSCWDNNLCHRKPARLLNDLPPEMLKTVTSECFSSLQDVAETDLSQALPFLADTIFSHYNDTIHENTAQAMRGAQLWHFAEQMFDPICLDMCLCSFQPSTVTKISQRCLNGVLLSRFKLKNLLYLYAEIPSVFPSALWNPSACDKVSLSEFAALSLEKMSSIDPTCFSSLKDVHTIDLSLWLPYFRDDIFANYERTLSKETVAALTPEHMKHFASSITWQGRAPCQSIDFSPAKSEIFATMPPNCVVNALNGVFAHGNRCILEHISQEAFKYLMSNPKNICHGLQAKDLLKTPVEFNQFWSSHCISLIRGIDKISLGERLIGLVDNIFQDYNGNFSDSDLASMPASKMAYFASNVTGLKYTKIDLLKLNKKALCKVRPEDLIMDVQSGGVFSAEAWKALEMAGILTESFFLSMTDRLKPTNWILFPVSIHWVAWYSAVKNDLSSLFREQDPDKFANSLPTHRSAILWLLTALKFRHLDDYGMIEVVCGLVSQFSEPTRQAIRLRLAQSGLWFENLLEMTFITTPSEAESQLRSRYRPDWMPPMIPLFMVDGVFDFRTSYDYVVKNGDNILHEAAQLRADKYLDLGGPMRMWVEQMLKYIKKFGLLEVTTTGEIRFPFFADPSVGAFVGVVYAKALQLQIKPPLSIQSLLELVHAPQRQLAAESNTREFYSRMRGDFSMDRFQSLLASSTFVEPEDMQTWHPTLRPALDIWPDVVCGSQPSKLYTNITLESDFVPRLQARMFNELTSLVSLFLANLVKTFNLLSYLAMPNRDFVQGLFGKTITLSEQVILNTSIQPDLSQTLVDSLIDENVKIPFRIAFESIIYAFGKRELTRLMLIGTGSRYAKMQAYKPYVRPHSLLIPVSSEFAVGDTLFITESIYSKLVQKAREYQQEHLKLKASDLTMVRPTQFFASRVLACFNYWDCCVQSSHQLLLSLLYLLNEDPSGMDDGVAASRLAR